MSMATVRTENVEILLWCSSSVYIYLQQLHLVPGPRSNYNIKANTNAFRTKLSIETNNYAPKLIY